jgi:hypothetical protein
MNSYSKSVTFEKRQELWFYLSAYLSFHMSITGLTHSHQYDYITSCMAFITADFSWHYAISCLS